ncbi:hypothetical protein ACWJJH_12090 [Endozoicomonadaceae bacterium StTr2]
MLVDKFLMAWGLTLIFELPVLYFVLRYQSSTSDILKAGIAATTLTIPWLWFVLPEFVESWALYVWIGESAVILIETWVLANWLRIRLQKSFLAAAIANVASVLAGFLIFN